MSSLFDVELFVAAMVTGSHGSRQHHIRQAEIIQAEISERWHRKTPWSWQKSTWLGFLSTVYIDAAIRHGPTMY